MKMRLLVTTAMLGVTVMSASACADQQGADGVPEVPGFAITSSAFDDGEAIPLTHATEAAGGENESPPLRWTGAPDGTTSFAIEVVDMHPMARQWVHWLVVDLPSDTSDLPAGSSGGAMPAGARELVNGFGTVGWAGPQPPPGTGVHEYRITLYALDAATVDLAQNATLGQFRAALAGHTLGAISVTGTFER